MFIVFLIFRVHGNHENIFATKISKCSVSKFVLINAAHHDSILQQTMACLCYRTHLYHGQWCISHKPRDEDARAPTSPQALLCCNVDQVECGSCLAWAGLNWIRYMYMYMYT